MLHCQGTQKRGAKRAARVSIALRKHPTGLGQALGYRSGSFLAPAHLHLTPQGVPAHKSPPSPGDDPKLPATRICVTIRLPYRKTFVFLCIYPQSKFTPYAKEGLPRGGDGTTLLCRWIIAQEYKEHDPKLSQTSLIQVLPNYHKAFLSSLLFSVLSENRTAISIFFPNLFGNILTAA